MRRVWEARLLRGRRRAQVGQPAVGARADEHLVDPGALELRSRRRVVDAVWPGHHRDDVAGVELDDALVGGAGVGGERPPGLLAVSYTHLRAHETVLDLVCRLL